MIQTQSQTQSPTQHIILLPGTIRVTCTFDGAGEIESDLRAGIDDQDVQGSLYHAAVDGLETLILACACAEVDLESEAFHEAVATAIESIVHNYG